MLVCQKEAETSMSLESLHQPNFNSVRNLLSSWYAIFHIVVHADPKMELGVDLGLIR